MLFQFEDTKFWDPFIYNPENIRSPGEVLEALARGKKIWYAFLLKLGEGKKIEEMTVFILIDGIQELPHNPGQQDSLMKQAINSVASIVNSYPCFCIAAIAGTFYTNILNVLAQSPQLRIFLTPHAIDGHKILSKYANDPFVSLLIDDMGGHGRALEALSDELEATNLDDITASIFMSQVKERLSLRYSPLKDIAPKLIPALTAILTRKLLAKTDTIPNSDMTVQDLISFGLFRWKSNGSMGYIECPFAILWLLASWSNDKHLTHFQLDNYNEIHHNLNPELPLGLQCWQHWEETTAYFRILKSSLLDGCTVSLSELHSGALLSTEARDLKVKVKRLEGKLLASSQYETGKFAIL